MIPSNPNPPMKREEVKRFRNEMSRKMKGEFTPRERELYEHRKQTYKAVIANHGGKNPIFGLWFANIKNNGERLPLALLFFMWLQRDDCRICCTHFLCLPRSRMPVCNSGCYQQPTYSQFLPRQTRLWISNSIWPDSSQPPDVPRHILNTTTRFIANPLSQSEQPNNEQQPAACKRNHTKL